MGQWRSRLRAQVGRAHWAEVVAATNAGEEGGVGASVPRVGSGSGSGCEWSGLLQPDETMIRQLAAKSLCERHVYTLKKVTKTHWGRNGPFAQDPRDVADVQKDELGAAEAFWG